MHTVKSRSFNPFQYSSSNYREDETTENYFDGGQYDEIVTKGGKKVFKVDIGHFDKLCKKFKDKCDIRLKNLHGRDREDFNLMVSYVHLLYGTSYYEHLHKKVKKHFGDLDRVKPGTVGGYFGGCLASTSFKGQSGCSVACAGSVPLPKDEEGWSFCDKAVIFAEYNNKGGYNFSILKQPDKQSDMDPCYLFVECEDLHDFLGFSKEEKEELKKLGAKNVHLIGCDEDGTKYLDLYGDSCSLGNIKHRKYHKNDSNNSGLGLALVLIIIFLLLIVLFFGWRFWNKDGDLFMDW